jgi:hypothetical protein
VELPHTSSQASAQRALRYPLTLKAEVLSIEPIFVDLATALGWDPEESQTTHPQTKE